MKLNGGNRHAGMLDRHDNAVVGFCRYPQLLRKGRQVGVQRVIATDIDRRRQPREQVAAEDVH